MRYYKLRRTLNLLSLGYLVTRYSEQICHDCLPRYPRRPWQGRGRLVSPYHRGNHRVNGFGLRKLVPIIDPKYSRTLKIFLETGQPPPYYASDSAGTPIWKPTAEQRARAQAAGDVDYRSTFRSVNYPEDDNQGYIGSCTSWNCIHHLTYWLIRAGKYIAKLSAKYCYWWIRKLGGLPTDEDTGGNMIDVGKCEIQKGAPLNSTFPDDGYTYDESPTAAAEAEAPKSKLNAVQERVLPSDFKTAMVATGGPINIGLPVDHAFKNASFGGWVTKPDIYEPQSLVMRFIGWILRVFKGILGYHAVLLVAIVTEKAPDGTTGEFLIIMNSWGRTGDRGHWHLGPKWVSKYLNELEAYKLTVKSTPPTENVILTVQKEGQGTITPNDVGTWSYAAGSKVTLTATPASNWKFSKWTGAISSTNPSIALTMNSDKTVKATFVSEEPEPPEPPDDRWRQLIEAIVKALTDWLVSTPKRKS